VLVIDQTGTVEVQQDLLTVQRTKQFVDLLLTVRRREARWTEMFVDDPAMRPEHLLRAFLAEQAFAEYLDCPYRLEISDKARRTDVDGIEVRAVRRMTDHLITQPFDKQAPYVLAVVDHEIATVILRGWLELRDCNVREHWRSDAPRPAFFTPATALHPPATLRDQYQQRKRRS